MGKAARWFKGLLGMKKEKENPPKHSNENNMREKRRWSFARPGRDTVPPLGQIPVNIPTGGGDSDWLGNYLSESEKEQNKHAIAVAAATAAAADAAVAAAQAAVAVVRLTSNSRASAALFSAGREKSSVVKIQTVFRGYLARKALRALKGLVKLQAHVRGYLVRKQATATLHSMQALVRAQDSARAQRARRSVGKDGLARVPPENRARRFVERFEEPRSEFHSKRMSATYDPCYDDSPKIVEIDTYKPRSRSSRRSNYPPSVSDYGDDSGLLQYPVSSPLPTMFPAPARLSIPDRHHHHHNDRYDWGLYEDEDRQCLHRIASMHSTPRCANTARAYRPSTLAKSVCGESYYRPYYHHHLHHHSNNYHPNYMANTQSFRAKLRSQSAPRHRPEPSPSRKRMSLNEVMASRNSVSGVRMQRPSIDVQEALFIETA